MDGARTHAHDPRTKTLENRGQTMPTLYEHPLSPYAQKVKIALREKNIPFEVKTPDGIGAGGAGGEFTRANPRAEVPALIDEGEGIFDSTIILEYIEDKWPSPALLPADPAARAKQRMIEEICDTQYEAINWGMGELLWFGRGGEAKDTILAHAKAQTEKLQGWLTRQLGDADWFAGKNFGWGDLSAVPYVAASIRFGFAPEKGSPLSNWLDRAMRRDSVAPTLAESETGAGDMGNIAELLEQGLFKREYRDHRLEWMMRSGGVPVVLDGLEKGNIRYSYEIE